MTVLEKQLNFRIDTETLQKMEILAKAQDRSINQIARQLIRDNLDTAFMELEEWRQENRRILANYKNGTEPTTDEENFFKK